MLAISSLRNQKQLNSNDTLIEKWHSLPKELWVEIFSFLNSNDLCHCSLVNREFNEITTSELLPIEFIWGETYFKRFSKLESMQAKLSMRELLILKTQELNKDLWQILLHKICYNYISDKQGLDKMIVASFLDFLLCFITLIFFERSAKLTQYHFYPIKSINMSWQEIEKISAIGSLGVDKWVIIALFASLLFVLINAVFSSCLYACKKEKPPEANEHSWSRIGSLSKIYCKSQCSIL